MNEEQIKYEDYQLDPSKEVLVPLSTYVALTNIMQEVERQHSKRVRSDKYAWFNRKTHEQLSAKGKAKMKPEKLHKEYYENIDLDATAKNIRVDRDELGSAAIQVLAEFKGIFRLNVDRGNAMLRPEVQAARDAAKNNSQETVDQAKEQPAVVQGPTLAENES